MISGSRNDRHGVTEEWFWEIVEFADWPLHQYGATEDGLMRMMARLTPQEAEHYRQVLQTKEQQLKGALTTHVSCGGDALEIGDDGLDDVVRHTIALGREEFERTLRHPQRLVDRGQVGDFTESFSYTVPCLDAYDRLEARVQNFVGRAREIRSDYSQLFGIPALRYVLPWLREIIRLLDSLEAKDWQTFADEEDRIRRTAADLTDYLAVVQRGHDWQRRTLGLPEGGAAEPERQLRELYRDVRRWFVELPRLRAQLRPDLSEVSRAGGRSC